MKTAESQLKSILSLIFLASIICVTSNAQTPNNPQLLQPNQTIEREMTGKTTHQYKFDVQKDEFFQVRVEQKGVDVALKLLDAKGNVLAEMDSPNGKEGFETLTFVANANGSFILEVISPNEKAEKGIYIISRIASRTATEKDKRRVEVEKIFVEAIKASKTEGQKEIAVSKLKEALNGWQELEDDYLKNVTSLQVYSLQVPTEISNIIKELNKEVDATFKFLQEGQILASKSDTESLKAREKLNQSLSLSQTLNKKVTDKSLLDQIKNSGETANQSLNILKTFEFYSKYIEAVSFEFIAQTHANLNERQSQLDYLRKSVQVYEEVIADKTFPSIAGLNMNAVITYAKKAHAVAIGNIGHALNEYFGDFEESIRYLEKSAQLFNQLFEVTKNNEYKWLESVQLGFIGSVYGKDSKNSEKAIEYKYKSIKILQTLPNREAEVASALTSIGIQYFLQYNFLEAEKIHNKTLEIYRKLNDKKGQAGVLRQFAFMYYNLNNKAKVADYVKQILEILQSPDYVNDWKQNTDLAKIDQKDFEIYDQLFTALFEWNKNDDIAFAYRMLEDYEKSLEYYKKALEVAPRLKNANSTKLIINSVAYTLAKLKRWNEAADYYKKALEISRQVGGKEDIAIALSDVGWTLMEAKKFDEALKFQNESLAIYQSEGYDDGKTFSTAYSSLLTELSQTYYGLGNKRFGILYGKRAVNTMQGERQRLQNLDLISQKGFLERKEKHYRRLAEWLIEAGRLVEAEQVLAMLKQEEVADYLRRDRAFAEKLNLRIDFTPKEKEALAGYQKKSETLSAIGAEFSKLEDLKRKGVKLTEEQEKRFEELNGKLKIANQDFQNFLDELAKEFGKGKDKGISSETGQNIQGRLAGWGEGVAYIYTVVGENLNVVLHTSDVNVSKVNNAKMTAAELNEKIFAFRAAVKNPKVDPRPLGKELYDVLIKPFETELDAAKAKMILWSLDGNLRLLPLAALWDGKQYLGQKYQNVVFTQASLFDVEKEVSTNPNVLALGVSDAKTVEETLIERKFTFNALPSVPFELGSIVKTKQTPKGVLSGMSLLNDGFTRKSFAEQLLNKYKIVHIASHFSMNAGDASRSFLLLGDGTTLTVSELNTEPSFKQKFQGVELLTLSACDTAVGETDSNGKEVEGFAYVAQQNGAKAILATLWSVADESTQLLMTEFYRLRKDNPNLSKAEAIQLAQNAMISGKLKSSGKTAGCRSEVVKLDGAAQTEFKCDTNAPFSHPYFWSPFVLIGNWR